MRIFKDPRDTFQGFRGTGTTRKQYDLEGVPHAHLYYNKRVDRKLDNKRRKEVIKSLRHEPEISDSSYDAIIKDLTNYALIERGIHVSDFSFRQNIPKTEPAGGTTQRSVDRSERVLGRLLRQALQKPHS